jgi:hypothetical protein
MEEEFVNELTGEREWGAVMYDDGIVVFGKRWFEGSWLVSGVCEDRQHNLLEVRNGWIVKREVVVGSGAV